MEDTPIEHDISQTISRDCAWHISVRSEYRNRNIDDATAKHMIEIFLDELQKQGRTRISALDVVYELGLNMMQVKRIMDSMKDDGVVRDD